MADCSAFFKTFSGVSGMDTLLQEPFQAALTYRDMKAIPNHFRFKTFAASDPSSLTTHEVGS